MTVNAAKATNHLRKISKFLLLEQRRGTKSNPRSVLSSKELNQLPMVRRSYYFFVESRLDI